MDEEDQITHMIALDEEIDPETGLDVFKVTYLLILDNLISASLTQTMKSMKSAIKKLKPRY